MVLFVDFEKPLRFPANILNQVLLRLAVLTPYLREGNGKSAALGAAIPFRHRLDCGFFKRRGASRPR